MAFRPFDFSTDNPRVVPTFRLLTNNMINRFTEHLKNTLKKSERLALEQEQTEITRENLLWAMAISRGSLAAELLKKADYQPVLPGQTLNTLITKNQSAKLSNAAESVLMQAMVAAHRYKHTYVGTEHLLWAILQLPTETLITLPNHFSLLTGKLKNQVLKVLKGTAIFSEVTEPYRIMEGDELIAQHLPALNSFGTNLVDQNEQATIDPIIGCQTELERLIHILSRRNKNNPLIIGEPGVGKTALVEGLAKKILAGEVPDVLRDKKIYAVDLS